MMVVVTHAVRLINALRFAGGEAIVGDALPPAAKGAPATGDAGVEMGGVRGILSFEEVGFPLAMQHTCHLIFGRSEYPIRRMGEQIFRRRAAE